MQRLIPDPLLDWAGLDCFPFTSLYHVMCVCSVGSGFPRPTRRKNGLSLPSFLLSYAWDERLLRKSNLVFGNCFFSFSNFYRVFLAVCDPLFLDRYSKSISFTLITSTGQEGRLNASPVSVSLVVGADTSSDYHQGHGTSHGNVHNSHVKRFSRSAFPRCC